MGRIGLRDLRIAALLLVLSVAGCATPLPKGSEGRPIPKVDVPSSLRPCCAFGHRLGLSLAGIPLPFRLDNVVAPEDLGPHGYDSGLVRVDGTLETALLSSENNGLVYTRRGGFVDTAHVRDYADWTFFFWSEIARMLDTGGRIELPDEGGVRIVYVIAAARHPAFEGRVDRDELSIAMAQWLAFELSIWHETATGYGWSALSGFPELASAFSPEDLYSNRLGIEIAGDIIRRGDLPDTRAFERAMDASLLAMLEVLGGVSHDETHEAMAAVDVAQGAAAGWWDSRKRLPEKDLVVRRNLHLGPEITPWRVEDPNVPHGEAVVLRHESMIQGVALDELVRLDVRPDEVVAARLPDSVAGRIWFSQADLRELVEAAGARLSVDGGEVSGAP